MKVKTLKWLESQIDPEIGEGTRGEHFDPLRLAVDEMRTLLAENKDLREFVALVSRYTKRERNDVDVSRDDMVSDWLAICEGAKALSRRKKGRKS